MKASLVAWTYFDSAIAAELTEGVWQPDPANPHSGSALAEFAGRACYQSWTKPNPATASNAGYLRHILEVKHGSVLEHATATFYLTEVSRAFTHELIRHRHFSVSELSQRYVDRADANIILPDPLFEDPKAYTIVANTALAVRDAYQRLTELMAEKFAHIADNTRRRKLAREHARRVLMEATETRIVVTGNYRAWMTFIDQRATEAADVEINEVAVDILKQLQNLAPNVFGHYQIKQGELGEYAEFGL